MLPATVLALLLALLLPAGAWGAVRDFYFQRLGSEQGLTQNSVGVMLQDQQGFVWVGTQGGLHRYDGQRFRVFRQDPADPSSLPDSFITALALGGDEALWVGTYSQYVARLDLRTGRIQRYLASAGSQRDGRQVLALWADPDAVWVGTVAGLDRLDPRTGKRERVLELDTGHSPGHPGQQLLRDPHGRLWYATADGVFVADRGTAPRRVTAAPAYALLEGDDGQVLVGGGSGVDAVHVDGSVRRVWPAPAAPGRGGQVRALSRDHSGRLWISVYGDGLRRVDPRTGRIDEIRHDADMPATLPEDTVASLLVTRGGTLWTGGQFRGVALADPGGSHFAYIADTDPPPGVPAAADRSIRSIHGTADALWFGTDAGRLQRYRFADRRLDDFTGALPAPAGRVAGFATAGRDRLWVASETGLLQLDLASGRLQRVDLGATHRLTAFRAITRDRRGDVWLGTADQGALHYSPATGRVVHYGARTLSHGNVHALLADRHGRIWFGTGDGLDILDTATGRLHRFQHAPDRPDSLPSNIVRAIHEDQAGRVWVGTHAGLRQAEVTTTAAGLSLRFSRPATPTSRDRRDPIVYSLQEGADGVLWAGTDMGLMRYRSDTGHARLFGLGDGLQALEFNGGASATLPDGRLAFGGVAGINLVDPRRLVDSRFVAPVRLLSARIGAQGGDPMLWESTALSLPAGADLLRLRVGVLDFAPSVQPRYRYRLEGFDRDWIDNGTQQEITYTHLPPGAYTFHAQATDPNGRWGGGELRVPVRVAAPLWRHPLVLAGLVLIVLGPAVAAGWQWRTRLLRERRFLHRLREREERLKLALWASGEQFWDYELGTRVMHRMQCSDPEGRAAGLGLQAFDEADHRIHPEDLPRVQQQLRRHVTGEIGVFESEHRVIGQDGDWVWIRARGRVVERDAAGRAVRVAGTARDVTANRRAERDRRVASEVLRSMAEAVCVFDDDFDFISVNPAFTRMTGYTEAEVAGQPTSLIDSRQHAGSVYRTMREELRREGRWSGELWQRRKDGSEFLCWLQTSVVLDSTGERGHWVAVLSDITEQKRAEQELRYLANYDTLTGLPNRALLTERLSRAIIRARRHDSRIAVLFLDLDRFKDINDSLGHAAGDAILRATAARLQHTVGAQHTVARLGGDEFTVVLEHLEGTDEAEQVARDLLAAFEQPLDAGDLRDITISPSIGISIYPEHAETPSDLLKHADMAMYQAKAIGRRTFMRYSGSMDVDIRRRATLSAALRKVIDRDELHLVYQPRMSVSDGRLLGVEALLRWSSAEFGSVSPMQFIPLAEESGLILEIGEWALRQACRQLQAWRGAGLDIAMAVNVSALQLRRGDLAGLIETTLHETGLPADRLELELTESVVMAEETWPAMHAIRALGVHMAIDDFGTGYSSLAYLKRLPINTLKIDKEFIGDLTRDPDDEAITSAVIAMGHSLGLRVVAEGVETIEQLDFLRRYGCDEIQGYWLARPMDADACEAFLRDWSPGNGRPATCATGSAG